MPNEITFNPTGEKLNVDIQVTGLVIVSYSLRLWSVSPPEEKVVQEEIGNNLQSHDDFFWLRNKSQDHLPEEVAKNNGRIVELISTVNTNKDEVEYTIKMVFSQGDNRDQQTPLEDVFIKRTIKKSDGHHPSLYAILKAQ
ncbi:hypothetical protein [Marinoscillum sp. MHG1-6]|uniref:hypothetical protein n=1 Tax=Marinoscillum sp. MHG1-6 TaxID=2959627 RepID=UPI0021583ABC|nr:hypothetical protein [Marinoscillum sp. MHG1-6]